MFSGKVRVTGGYRADRAVQLSEDSGGEVETGYKVGAKDVQWVGKQRGARLGWKRCSV